MDPGVRYRAGTEDDLDACTRIWKAAIDDYQGRLSQPPMPDDLGPLRRLLGHFLATDPDRFWVAERADGEHCIGFGSATVRDDLWFLGMLFVDPGLHAGGIGSALLDRTLGGSEPGVRGGPAGITRWGTCTDSAQPVSNGLYARRGLVPRVPVWRLSGEIRRPGALPALSPGLEAVPFEAIAAEGPDGHRRLADAVNEVDRAVIGLEHGRDHAFLRREGREGLLVRERGGRPVGYGYGSGVGRLGPVAALDPDELPAVIGAVLHETPPAGAVVTRPPPLARSWRPASASRGSRACSAGPTVPPPSSVICRSRWHSSDPPGRTSPGASPDGRCQTPSQGRCTPVRAGCRRHTAMVAGPCDRC
jgi:GNAT superfamily N-acetyltransferase